MGILQLWTESKHNALLRKIIKDTNRICDTWIRLYKTRVQQDPAILALIGSLYDSKKIIALSFSLGSRMCEIHGTQDRQDFLFVSAIIIKRLVGESFVEPYASDGFYYDLEVSMNRRVSSFIPSTGGNMREIIWAKREEFPYFEWICMATYQATDNFKMGRKSALDENLLLFVALDERY